ncbi:MAG: alpha/beta hydrolase [Candidatus Eremiobacteraeota bacterium]|nr:alpha/beta hydrolase [Candidatus Eremiobacteraeota bacterium]
MPTFVTGDGAELSYFERGPRGALAILFLHGWQGAGAVWLPIVERLAARYRTIALDIRGFGASNAAPGPFRVETFADDVSALVAALDLDPMVVVGHSMGAAIAQRFAIDRPDAVEGLVLVAPVPASGVPFSPKIDAMFRATAGNPENANAWLSALTYSEPTPEARTIMRAAAAATPGDVALESFDSWTHVDFAYEAATIETPTLVLAPAADRPMTPEFTRERVADVIPESRLVVVEEAGHYLPLERPDRVAELIDGFVAAL